MAGRIARALALAFALGLPGPAFAGGDAVRGKEIFDTVCQYCHRADDYDEKFGPGLKGIGERVGDAWLDRWLADPEGLIRGGDEYAKALRESNRWGLTMPIIPAMQDPAKRADVIAYLKTL